MVGLAKRGGRRFFPLSLVYLVTGLIFVFFSLKIVNGGEKSRRVGLAIGNLAPDFVLPSLLGKEVCLSDLKGKKVILNFWSTWCKPCVEEMPDMQAFYEKYKAAGIEILAISINRERDSTVEHFARWLNLTFPVLLDRDKVVARRYRIFSLPTSFLINKEGIIEKKWYGKMDLDKEGLLSEIREAAALSP
jgi:peroxiredoxin